MGPRPSGVLKRYGNSHRDKNNGSRDNHRKAQSLERRVLSAACTTTIFV
jgi:ribosomal protein L3